MYGVPTVCQALFSPYELVKMKVVDTKQLVKISKKVEPFLEGQSVMKITSTVTEGH